MFERRNGKLAPVSVFVKRMAMSLGVALAMIAASLFVGIAGYHWLAGYEWIDSLLEASMILGGMGPVDSPHTTGGKLFAGFYALYAGLVVLVAAGAMFLPVLHRLMHTFHQDH